MKLFRTIACGLSATIAILAIGPQRAGAATVAADDASNYSAFGAFSATNAGSGFGAWTLTGSDNNSSHEGSYLNTTSKAISISTKAWGFYANSATPTMIGERPFTGSLSTGQVFQIDIESDGCNAGTGHATPPGASNANQFGFELRNGSTSRFRFYFVGGQTQCQFDDSVTSTGIGTNIFPSGGMRIAFRLLTVDTYEFTVISPNSGQAIYHSGTRTLGGTAGTGVDRVDLYVNNSSGDTYFNSMKIWYDAPRITAGPSSTTAVCSGNATPAMTVAASSTDGSTLSYAWRKRGTGWGGHGWTITDTVGNGGAGHLIGEPNGLNGQGSPAIGTSCWQLYSFGSTAQDIAFRALPALLVVNQSLSIDMQNGSVSNTAKVGFALTDTNGTNYVEFQFIGGQNDYTIHDNSSTSKDAGVGFTSGGLNFTFTLTSATTYTLRIKRYADGETVVTSGTLLTAGVGGIGRLYMWNIHGGNNNDVFFNNISVAGADDNASNYGGTWTSGAADTFGQAPLTDGVTGNGSFYAGSATTSFTITNAQTADSASYDCAVMSGQGYTTNSSASALTVNQSPTITSATPTQPTCNGSSNGQIAIVASGANTLNYSIDGTTYQAGSTLTSLTAGTYTVYVKDTVNNCVTTQSGVVVGQPSVLSLSLSPTNPGTCGGANGSIQATFSGGTGTLQIQIDNGTYTPQTSPYTFTGLSAGLHTVYLQDANNCTTNLSITLTDPSGPSLGLSQTPTTCNGGSDGQITATFSGNGPFSVQIDGGSYTPQTSPYTFTGLSAGSHTVTVKDVNGCTTPQLITVTQPPALNLSLGQTATSCNGGSDGKVTATFSGGTGTLQVQIDGGSYSPQTSPYTFIGLSAGSHTVYLRDANGCTTSQSIMVNQPTALSCSVTPSSATNCAGSSQIFTVSVNGGTAGYTYSWSGPNSFSATGSSATNNNLQPASAGTYTATVTDANGCQSTCTATLTVNVAPSITGQPTNTAVCAGSSTNLSVIASGSPLNYVWRKLGSGWGGGGWSFTNSGAASSEFIGSSTDNDSGDTASNGGNDINTSGQAWALFNNGGAADARRPFNTPLAVGQTFSIDMDNGNVQTGGTVGFGLQNTANSNNRLEVFFVGGSNDYTVSDNAGSNDSGIGFTRTGIRCQITLTSTDAYSITIIRFAGSATAITNTLTGTLKGTAGTVIDRIRFFNANAGDCGFGCNQNTLYFNNISFGCNDDNAGNYTNWVAGSDLGQGPLANGGDVSGATTATLTINPASAGDAGSYDVFVTNACGIASSSSAALTVNPLPSCSITGTNVICQGGSTVFCATDGMSGYSWTGPSSFTANSECVTVSVAGLYNVTITDSNGCTSSCSQALTVNPLPSCSITGTNVICQGGSTVLCATDGMASYSWGGPGGFSASTQCITISIAGLYSVTITDSNGCSSSCSQALTVNASPTCNISGTSVICQGGSTVFCATDGMSGYSWTGPSSFAANTECVTVSVAGLYNVTISDSNGCSSSCSQALTVNPLPNCSITGTNVICQGGSTVFCATDGMASYSWTGPSAFTANSECVTVGVAGLYSVTITDSNGCSSGCSQTLTVNPAPATPTAGSNSPIHVGDTLNLTAATVAGVTYAWTGPNSFTSSTQNPSISNAPAAASGTYTVTVTDTNDCMASSSTTVLVSVLQITSITSQGGDILITWIGDGGTTNQVQVTSGTANGSYSNNYADLSSQLLLPGAGQVTTNYLEVGGATNAPSRYYRIRLVP